MKYNKFIVVLMLLLIFITGCTNSGAVIDNDDKEDALNNEKNITYKKISPSDAKEMLDKDDKIILLDVRTEMEYNEKHIPNSILIPVDVLESKAGEKLENKEATIYVYCRSGNRSNTASNTLINLGYTNVYDLGGIINWPYETEN